MGIARKAITVVAAVMLAVSFVGAGFLVCTTPPVTGALANVFSDDATSPFSRSQLVQVAEATRDYSFGSHSKTELYCAIYDVDAQLRQTISAGGSSLLQGFPDLDAVSDPGDYDQLARAFANASEMYCFSPDAVAHLDDCYAIASTARPLLIVAAVLALIGLALVGVMGRKRALGRVLLAVGIVVLAAFVALGVWAAIDFTGFFATFHGLFFRQGNWTFPYDSLLICALPQAFWIGMAVIWLAVAVVLSALAIAIGRRLR